MAIYLGNTLLTGPSGGTGDAVLADDQTFTGINTFNNAAGIQAERIVGATDMHIIANGNEVLTLDDSLGAELLQISAPSALILRGASSVVGIIGAGTSNQIFAASSEIFEINPSLTNDIDFKISKTGAAALEYDNGTDTLTVGADNIVGVAGSESGFWTPTWNNIGTIAGINTRYTYSRVGQTVTLKGEVFVSAGTSTSMISILASSLPYTVQIDTNNVASGTFYTSTVAFNTPNLSAISFTGVVLQISGSLYFVDSRTNNTLSGTNPNGFLGFTVTYITSD